MLKQRGFFDIVWNKNGKGIPHHYERIKRRGEMLIHDYTTGLTWQKGGSSNVVKNWDYAKKVVKELNWNSYAGYNNWRLPTLEEAMSLMEATKHGELYIDPVFDSRQRWIWTSDQVTGVKGHLKMYHLRAVESVPPIMLWIL
jgi:hypothetical protein